MHEETHRTDEINPVGTGEREIKAEPTIHGVLVNIDPKYSYTRSLVETCINLLPPQLTTDDYVARIEVGTNLANQAKKESAVYWDAQACKARKLDEMVAGTITIPDKYLDWSQVKHFSGKLGLKSEQLRPITFDALPYVLLHEGGHAAYLYLKDRHPKMLETLLDIREKLLSKTKDYLDEQIMGVGISFEDASRFAVEPGFIPFVYHGKGEDLIGNAMRLFDSDEQGIGNNGDEFVAVLFADWITGREQILKFAETQPVDLRALYVGQNSITEIFDQTFGLRQENNEEILEQKIRDLKVFVKYDIFRALTTDPVNEALWGRAVIEYGEANLPKTKKVVPFLQGQQQIELPQSFYSFVETFPLTFGEKTLLEQLAQGEVVFSQLLHLNGVLADRVKGWKPLIEKTRATGKWDSERIGGESEQRRLPAKQRVLPIRSVKGSSGDQLQGSGLDYEIKVCDIKGAELEVVNVEKTDDPLHIKEALLVTNNEQVLKLMLEFKPFGEFADSPTLIERVDRLYITREGDWLFIDYGGVQKRTSGKQIDWRVAINIKTQGSVVTSAQVTPYLDGNESGRYRYIWSRDGKNGWQNSDPRDKVRKDWIINAIKVARSIPLLGNGLSNDWVNYYLADRTIRLRNGPLELEAEPPKTLAHANYLDLQTLLSMIPKGMEQVNLIENEQIKRL